MTFVRCVVGKYSEHAFQALDYILDEASKYGVRLLFTLVNNWDNADSKTQVQHLHALLSWMLVRLSFTHIPISTIQLQCCHALVVTAV